MSIKNVHVRYEDTTSRPDKPFTFGLTARSISVDTVNEHGEKVFVDRANNPSIKLLHRWARIQGLTMCVHAPLCTPLSCMRAV